MVLPPSPVSGRPGRSGVVAASAALALTGGMLVPASAVAAEVEPSASPSSSASPSPSAEPEPASTPSVDPSPTSPPSASPSPEPSATASADEATGTKIWVDGQLCGEAMPEVGLDGRDYFEMSIAATLADAGASEAKVAIWLPDGTVKEQWRTEVVDGQIADKTWGTWRYGGDGIHTVAVAAVQEDGTYGDPASCEVDVTWGPQGVVRPAPVLVADAVYATGRSRGGVGVPGAFVVAEPSEANVVAYEYAFTDGPVDDSFTGWTRIEAEPNTVIPFTPTHAGEQRLTISEVNDAGLHGWQFTHGIEVADGDPEPTPPVFTVAEPADEEPDDGRIPVEAVLSREIGTRAMGEVVVRQNDRQVGRAEVELRTQEIVLEQEEVGSGFQTLEVEYRQFPDAEPATVTQQICAAACDFSGGDVTISRIRGELRAEPAGFSPEPAAYTYQWLRDGDPIPGETDERYLTVPTDAGHRITVQATATGPRMNGRTLESAPADLPGYDVGARYGVVTTGDDDLPQIFLDFADGQTAGDPGERRELAAVAVEPTSDTYRVCRGGSPSDGCDLWFEMEGFVQGLGWQGWKRYGQWGNYYVGSVGENRMLKAFRIDAAGPVSEYYDVYYKAFVPQLGGWLGWAKNGERAGARGHGYRVEAVKIKVLPRGQEPGASWTGNAAFYDRWEQSQLTVRPYLEPVGKWWKGQWKSAQIGGHTAGWPKTHKRLDALRVSVDGHRYSGGIKVKARVKGDGWRSFSWNGRTAGSTGRPVTSAYKMTLTGQMAEHYDVYYRVRVDGHGWLGWAKNGGKAGTRSYGERPTSVQVLLVDKGGPRPVSPLRSTASFIR
ncbi:hypothetical protein [Isoptericola haloaureus]|uniref:Hydrophobic W protein n=1 Tax=Isoptericola haloaureus TaxID=1542902 RepID=A0ABU7Z3D4_9MICO